MYVLIQIHVAYRDIMIMKHDSMIIQIVKDRTKHVICSNKKKRLLSVPQKSMNGDEGVWYELSLHLSLRQAFIVRQFVVQYL